MKGEWQGEYGHDYIAGLPFLSTSHSHLRNQFPEQWRDEQVSTTQMI
jgi:hypothetical protein